MGDSGFPPYTPLSSGTKYPDISRLKAKAVIYSDDLGIIVGKKID
jgi:hypothetical protein